VKIFTSSLPAADATAESAVVDMVVIVIVIGPVIVAVHVNVNPTVEVIATALR
jgi:hypothetical protein